MSSAAGAGFIRKLLQEGNSAPCPAAGDFTVGDDHAAHPGSWCAAVGANRRIFVSLVAAFAAFATAVRRRGAALRRNHCLFSVDGFKP